MCFGYRGEIQQPNEWNSLFQLYPFKLQLDFFVSGLSFVLLRILSFFSALAVQITITKYKEISGQF